MLRRVFVGNKIVYMALVISNVLMRALGFREQGGKRSA